MSKIVNIHEAKTHLSRLIEEVLAGNDVTIAKAGVPLIDLRVHVVGKRVFGALKDVIVVHDDEDLITPDPEQLAMHLQNLDKEWH